MNSSAPCRPGRRRAFQACAGLVCGVLVFGLQTARTEPAFDNTLLSPRDLKPIFNGTNLDGWTIRGGKATYAVVAGVIVGTCAVKNGGNTFLCTEKEYGDFILELEIQADKGLNSGVQIRSHCFDEATTYDFGNRVIKVPAKRVHGYQVEVDHRPERRWSGGIYEEGRREWLNPLATNSPAGPAFKFGEWNKYRIQCIGSSIKTWVNDIPAADLVDAETLKGFIGLQVHTADKPEYQVRFRNLRLQELGERQWRTAWDCRSFEGLDEQGVAEWKLADGVLHARHTQAETQSGTLSGHMPMENFTVRLKYKIEKGEFGLSFCPSAGGKTNAGFVIPVVEKMGVTNITKLQDWNSIVATVQGRRVVVNVNGHQANDSALAVSPGGVLPALRLLGGAEADVFFKDFEVLAPAN